MNLAIYSRPWHSMPAKVFRLMFAFGVALVTLLLLPSEAYAQSKPVPEGGTISTPAESMVLYGTGKILTGSYYKNATNVYCGNSTFGDPAVQMPKACVSIPLSSFTQCAVESGFCSVPNHDKVIIYGAIGHMLKAAYATGSNGAENCGYNSRPWYEIIPGIPKSCYSSTFAGIQIDPCTLPAAPGVNWDKCDKTRAVLTGANLSNSSAKQAVLAGADLTHVTATSANWWNADLHGANMSGGKFDGTIQLQSSNLQGANLTNADLGSADLSSADLTGANITQANLAGIHVNPSHYTQVRRVAEPASRGRLSG